ncbi:hypothetical protein Tco_0202849, partial [Tanacetum coccineum]
MEILPVSSSNSTAQVKPSPARRITKGMQAYKYTSPRKVSEVIKGYRQVGKPLYSRFTKTNDFKGVSHPLSGDYTPISQEEIDESLYIYGKRGPHEPEPNVSDDRSSEYSTCQFNDSAGSIGASSENFLLILNLRFQVYLQK